MKISIVTPTYNSGKFIEETICSVIGQKGNFDIEYTIMDNCSDDNTIGIIKNIKKRIAIGALEAKCNGLTFKYISQPDIGMYDAINKGLNLSSGDVFAWINADDIYLPGAFQVISNTFIKFPQAKWIKGITSYIDEKSAITKYGRCYLYDREWIRNGIYGTEAYFIQQDSVFWRAELWEKAGGINVAYKRAGDYFLWKKFSEYCELVSLNAYVSCFRQVNGQLSEDLARYLEECRLIEPPDTRASKKIKMFFSLEKSLPKAARRALFKVLFSNMRFSYFDIIGQKITLNELNDYYLV